MLLTFMHRLPRFISESRTLTTLALPIVLSQVAYTLLGLIDTVMAGRAGAVEQAAVALGVAFWMPVFITLMSVVQALSPSVAHHFGAGDYAAVVDDTHQGIWLAGIACLLPVVLMPGVAPVMVWAQIDPLLIGKTTLFLWGMMVGLPAATVEEGTRNLVDAVRDLNASMGIPAHVRDLKVHESEYRKNLDVMAANALEDICTRSNPRLPSHDDLVSLLESAW